MKISVIGTLLVDQICTSTLPLKDKGCNKVNLIESYGGSMHNVAWNLSTLGINCHFFVRLGNDDHAAKAAQLLTDKGCQVHGSVVNKATPHFYTFHNLDKSQIFSTITDEFYFNQIEEIHLNYLKGSEYIITDNHNKHFLEDLINQSSSKIICSRNIPQKNLLCKITGIVLNEWELHLYNQNLSCDENAQAILNDGCPWIIVTKSQNGATLYTKDSCAHFNVPSMHNSAMALGCGDAFLSGIVYALCKGLNILSCVPYGIMAASLVLSTSSAISNDIIKIKDEAQL